MKLGSPEYLEEIKKRSNADEEYRRLAANDTDSYTMVLEAEPAKGVSAAVTIGYGLQNGVIADIWSGERKTTYTLSGKYGVWVEILRGKLGPNKAFTMRKLKVRGNFLKLLAGSDSTLRWVEILKTIPTEFEGAYAQYNLPGQP